MSYARLHCTKKHDGYKSTFTLSHTLIYLCMSAHIYISIFSFWQRTNSKSQYIVDRILSSLVCETALFKRTTTIIVTANLLTLLTISHSHSLTLLTFVCATVNLFSLYTISYMYSTTKWKRFIVKVMRKQVRLSNIKWQYHFLYEYLFSRLSTFGLFLSSSIEFSTLLLSEISMNDIWLSNYWKQHHEIHPLC